MTRLYLLALVAAGCATLSLDPDTGAPTGGDGGGGDGGGGDGGDAGDGGDGGSPESCGMTLAGHEPFGLEGEATSFEISCASGAGRDGFVLQGANLPEGASLDGGDWRFSWTPGPDTAGKHEFHLVLNAGGGGLPESMAVEFDIAENPAAGDNVAADPLLYAQEWGLAVMWIDSQGSMSEAYSPAVITWEGKAHPGEAKIRGASSAYYPKKSFTLRFDEDEIDMGWGPDDRDHIVLVSNFDDNSHVRQKLVYDMWAEMAAYHDRARMVPRTDFVIVYLDGDYYGLFTALDHIDNEFARHMGLNPDGNLYKAVNHNANFRHTDYYGNAKTDLGTGYEKEEGDADWSDLQALQAWSGTSDHDTFWAEVDDWLPVDEYMDWFLLVHFTAADDSAGKNCYLYNDPADRDWRFTPWDFNHAWGQNWYTARISAQHYNDFSTYNGLFNHLLNHPEASAQVWARYTAMRADGPLSNAWMLETVDGYYADMAPAAQRDWDRWGEQYQTYSSWASTRSANGTWTDFDQERAYLYRWIEDRAEYMDSRH